MNKATDQLICFVVFATIVIAFGSSAEAQPTKVPRIGSLSGQSPSNSPARREAFQQGLRELGYVEGKNISLSGDMQRGNLIASPRLRRS